MYLLHIRCNFKYFHVSSHLPNSHNGSVGWGTITLISQMEKLRHSQFKPLSRFTRMAGGDAGSPLDDLTPGLPLHCAWNPRQPPQMSRGLWTKWGWEDKGAHGDEQHGGCLQGSSWKPLSRGGMAWGSGDSHSEDKYQQSGEWNPRFEVFWLVHCHQNRTLVGVRPNKGASTSPAGKVCMGSSFSVTGLSGDKENFPTWPGKH